jgi:hypothetical protein
MRICFFNTNPTTSIYTINKITLIKTLNNIHFHETSSGQQRMSHTSTRENDGGCEVWC